MSIFRHTVDSAISGLTKAVERLEQAAQYHRDQAAFHDLAAACHADAYSDHTRSANRADKVMSNIRSLIEGDAA